LHGKQRFDGARRFSRGGANQPVRVRLSHLLSSRPARVSAAGPILPVVRDRWGTGRIEAFSDGVFSIAATLLVLEIAVPEADFDHLWKGIADQWPAYLGYATSFLTIGGIWLVHHAIFRRLRFADFNVNRLNLLLLMAVAFLPFPTKLVAEVIESSSAERAAVLFYGATLLVISILITLIIRYAGSRPHLIEEEHREGVVALATQWGPNLGFYVVVLALAFLSPRVAAFGFLAIAVVAIMRVRGEPRAALS
jgi:uncharacterized membrane protein